MLPHDARATVGLAASWTRGKSYDALPHPHPWSYSYHSTIPRFLPSQPEVAPSMVDIKPPAASGLKQRCIRPCIAFTIVLVSSILTSSGNLLITATKVNGKVAYFFTVRHCCNALLPSMVCGPQLARRRRRPSSAASDLIPCFPSCVLFFSVHTAGRRWCSAPSC